MKKNNKGFFLAETIVMIALVTTVIAFLYPNVSKLYENYNNRVKYHDQTEDLYFLRYVHGYLTSGDQKIKINGTDDLEEITGLLHDSNLIGENGLKRLYITGYMSSPEDENNLEFNKYLHRLKKTTNEPTAYRLIGVFENNRYASIKIAGVDVELN